MEDELAERHGLRRTFSALSARNYRLFFLGHVVSQAGTWMQRVAQDWLILSLTDSPVALSVGIALQSLPVLLFGMWGGLIADRLDTRRLLLWSQVASCILALALGVLTLTGLVQLWMVFVLAVALGCVAVVEIPARQVLVMELVGPSELANAVSLNSSINNAARLVGPAVGGVLITLVGVAPTFLINAASFAAVIAALLLMDVAALVREAPFKRSAHQVREGLRYAWSTPEIRSPLMLVLLVSMFAQSFRIILPLIASEVFGRGAATYGSLLSMLGLGAMLGALACAHYARPSQRLMVYFAGALGLVSLIAAMAPTLALFTGLMVLVGAGSTSFNTTSNAVLQLRSAPSVRGRVMALRAILSQGTIPLGAPVFGWVCEAFNARVGFAVGGALALAAALLGAGTRHLDHPTRRSTKPPPKGVDSRVDPDSAGVAPSQHGAPGP